MDHIEPVVPESGWDSWDGYIERLFCNEDGYQVICKSCHKKKTASENFHRSKKKGSGSNDSSVAVILPTCVEDMLPSPPDNHGMHLPSFGSNGESIHGQ